MRFFALICAFYAMILCNMLRSVGGKRNVCVILVLCMLIRSERNVYSMWNGFDVGDM